MAVIACFLCGGGCTREVQWLLGLGYPLGWICAHDQQLGNTILQWLLHSLLLRAQTVTGDQALGCVCINVKGKCISASFCMLTVYACSVHFPACKSGEPAPSIFANYLFFESVLREEVTYVSVGPDPMRDSRTPRTNVGLLAIMGSHRSNSSTEEEEVLTEVHVAVD